jgi:hypothetical protein
LDSLVRIETYQWLRAIFRGSFFLSHVLAGEAGTASSIEAIRKGGIVRGASLIEFLIVSNQNVVRPAECAKLTSHPDDRGQLRHFHEQPQEHAGGVSSASCCSRPMCRRRGDDPLAIHVSSPEILPTAWKRRHRFGPPTMITGWSQLGRV